MFGSSATGGGGSLQPGFNTSSTAFGGMTGSSFFGNTQQKPAGGLFGGGGMQQQPGQQQAAPLFGSAPQAQTTGVFSGFGSTASGVAAPTQQSSIFGAKPVQQQQPSLFGGGGTSALPTGTTATTSMFGSNAQRPAGGLFGTQQMAQPTTSIFGTAPQAQTTGGGLFGGGGAFGQPAAAPQATSIFGATQPAQTSSLFGQTQPAAQTSSLFGQTQATGTMIKFDPLKASDTMLMGGVPKAISTKHMCISAMKQYEAKSLEELRVEDYLANRKTGTAAISTGASLFSNTQQKSTGTGMFGGMQQTGQQQAAPLFGSAPQAQTTGVFSGFGTATSGVAAPTQQSSIFGPKPVQQQPLFGGGGVSALPTSTAATISPFGSNTQRPAGGLFTTQQAVQPTTSFFGTAPQAQTTGVFSGGAFGQPATAPQATSIFGAPQQAQTSSLFGPTQPAQTSSLFGPTQPAQTSSLFGPTQAMMGGGLRPIQTINTPPVNMGNIQQAIIEAQLNALPYGDSPLLKMSTPLQGSGEKKSSDSSSITRRVSSVTTTSSARAASTPSAKQTPPSGKVPMAGANLNTSALNASFTYKPLVSLPYAGFGAPLSLGRSPAVTDRPSNASANDSTSLRSSSFLSQASREGEKGNVYRPSSTLKAKAFDVSVLRKQPSQKSSFNATPKIAECAQKNGSAPAAQKEGETRASDGGSAQLESSRREEPAHQAAVAGKSPPKAASGGRVVDEKEELRPEYYYRPSLDTLRDGFRDGVAKIDEGLTIGRIGYGSVFWRGPFEIHNIDSLPDVVHFRAREAVVYPDESTKPDVGVELNRPAEVSLERIWPISKETREPVKDSDEIRGLGFREKLEKMCEQFGGTFKDYNPATGTWTFSVPHF